MPEDNQNQKPLIKGFRRAATSDDCFMIVMNMTIPENVKPLPYLSKNGKPMMREHLRNYLIKDMKEYFGFEGFDEETGQVENHFFVGEYSNTAHMQFLALIKPYVHWLDVKQNNGWADYDVLKLKLEFEALKETMSPKISGDDLAR